MISQIACPKCHISLRVPSGANGKVGCPRCNERLSIPELFASEAEPLAVVIEEPIPQATHGGPPAAQPNRATYTNGHTNGDAGFSAKLTRSAAALLDDDNVAAALTKALVKKGTQGTQVNALVAAVLGFALTIGLYILVAPIHKTFLGSLLIHRGNIPIFIMFLSNWSLAILLLKSLSIRKQKRAFRLELLPEEVAEEITPENCRDFQAHLGQYAAQAKSSFLISRVARAVAHFRSRKSVQEVVTFLQTQSDIDATTIHSSYKLIKVCIWAIPILGFVGTVLGIGSAVGGFASTINGAGELDAIKDSLGSVTTGLALAFDTTLLALVMSMIVMFPMSHFQKSEEDLLNRVDDYCNEHLSRRLNDHGDGGASEFSRLTTVLQDVFTKHQQHWVKVCESTAQAIARQIGATFAKTQEKSLDENQKLVANVRGLITDTVRENQSVAERLNQLQNQQVDRFSTTLTQITEASAGIRDQLEYVRPTCQQTGSDLNQLLQQQDRFVQSASGQIGELSRLGTEVSQSLGQAAQRIAAVERIGFPPPEMEPHLTMMVRSTPHLLKAIMRLNAQLDGLDQSVDANGKSRFARWFRR